MPELPEVETVRRGLAPHLEGRRLARVQLRRADLRIPFPPDFMQALTGRRIERLARRAKYLVAELDNGRALLMHLGMSGRFSVHAAADSPEGPGSGSGPHDHVVLETDAGTRIVYTDHRRFGLMTLADDAAQHELLRHLGPEPLDGALSGPELAEMLKGRRSPIKAALLRHLGPEPLDGALSGPELADALEGRRSPIKAALLDQRIVAGVGNIYACEALYRARLSPRRQSGTVRGERASRLVRALDDVLTEAIEAGGSSVRDYAGTGGELGYFQHAFSVYGRAGGACKRPSCGGIVTRIVQSNRSTFLCSRCQR